MRSGDLSPLTVVPFNQGYLIDFVRFKTGWNQRDEVYSKQQLQYLCQYLSAKEIACQTMIVESEYIDRHYIEDYSEYYARCFPSHERKCSRIHFFSWKFEEPDFIDALSGKNADFIGKLSSEYIGFAVIRPIPHTFFAKMCLIPYRKLKEKNFILEKDIPVSLFGIPLNVKTIPFLEQDKVVSACATSALWTALSAMPDMAYANIPSPSAITKSATQGNTEGARTFPSTGLTVPQITRSIKYYGLEPLIQKLEENFEKLKEYIHAYISNNIPLILGGAVYEIKKTNNKITNNFVGQHLICVIGYSTSMTQKENLSENLVDDKNFDDHIMSLKSHGINKIFAHDDRYGPYMKLSIKECEIESKKNTPGLEIKTLNGKQEFFVPDIAIIGITHKVRIPYDHILSICGSLFLHIQMACCAIKNALKARNKKPRISKEQRDYLTKVSTCYDDALIGTWDIALTTNTALKKELREIDSFWTFNGIFEKTSILLKNLPKHIWRCRIWIDENHSIYSDILFDATEVPQGRILIGYITYDVNSQYMWDHIESSIVDRTWQTNFNFEDNHTKEFIGCFIKFFSEKSNEFYLNTTFGPLGLPRRPLKDGETDERNNIELRSDIFTVRLDVRNNELSFLTIEKKWIWVINEFGDIVLGEDIHSSEDGYDDYKGHPTLIDGKPGRIGGELFFSAEKDKWQINLFSRAYSAHVNKESAAAKRYLENVVKAHLSAIKDKIEIWEKEK